MTTVGHIAIVAQAMALEPIVVREDAPLSEAAALMDRHVVSGLPVVDHAGCLLGVISQADLVRARGTEYLWANWTSLSVGVISTTDVVHAIAAEDR